MSLADPCRAGAILNAPVEDPDGLQPARGKSGDHPATSPSPRPNPENIEP